MSLGLGQEQKEKEIKFLPEVILEGSQGTFWEVFNSKSSSLEHLEGKW